MERGCGPLPACNRRSVASGARAHRTAMPPDGDPDARMLRAACPRPATDLPTVIFALVAASVIHVVNETSASRCPGCRCNLRAPPKTASGRPLWHHDVDRRPYPSLRSTRPRRTWGYAEACGAFCAEVVVSTRRHALGFVVARRGRRRRGGGGGAAARNSRRAQRQSAATACCSMSRARARRLG